MIILLVLLDALHSIFLLVLLTAFLTALLTAFLTALFTAPHDPLDAILTALLQDEYNCSIKVAFCLQRAILEHIQTNTTYSKEKQYVLTI